MWGALAAAAGGIAGSLIDRSENRHAAKQQYKYNSWLQQQNEEFQKEMAQNAHQWEIQDLEKAGLNPIISANGSTAASIAGSSAAQGTSAGTASNLFGNKVSELMQMKQLSSATDLNKALEKQANSQANKFDVESGLMPHKTKAEIGNLDSNSAKMEAETRVNNAKIGLIDSETKLNQTAASLNETKNKTEKGKVENITGSMRDFGEDTLKWYIKHQLKKKGITIE